MRDSLDEAEDAARDDKPLMASKPASAHGQQQTIMNTRRQNTSYRNIDQTENHRPRKTLVVNGNGKRTGKSGKKGGGQLAA